MKSKTKLAGLTAIPASALIAFLTLYNAEPTPATSVTCEDPVVTDGDTFRCSNFPFPVRVTTDPSTPGIWFDTPETMMQHAGCPSELEFGILATAHLETLFKQATLITLNPPNKPPYKDLYDRYLFDPVLTLPSYNTPQSLHTLFPPELFVTYPAKEHPYDWCASDSKLFPAGDMDMKLTEPPVEESSDPSIETEPFVPELPTSDDPDLILP